MYDYFFCLGTLIFIYSFSLYCCILIIDDEPLYEINSFRSNIIVVCVGGSGDEVPVVFAAGSL